MAQEKKVTNYTVISLYFLFAQLECMWNFRWVFHFNKKAKKRTENISFSFYTSFSHRRLKVEVACFKIVWPFFWCSKNGRDFSLGEQIERNKWKCAPFFWKGKCNTKSRKKMEHAGNSQLYQEIYKHVKMRRKIVLLCPPCLHKKNARGLGQGAVTWELWF